MPLFLRAHATFRVTCHFLGLTLKSDLWENTWATCIIPMPLFAPGAKKKLVFHLVSLTLTLTLTLTLGRRVC